jgi:PTS system nitrogen regulatory IIA component
LVAGDYLNKCSTGLFKVAYPVFSPFERTHTDILDRHGDKSGQRSPLGCKFASRHGWPARLGVALMDNEIMDLQQLATYLHRDVREVSKMASRGYLPGRKVGGEWRFASAEINYWIETQLHSYDDRQLIALDGSARNDDGPLVTPLLSEATIAVPLAASTRSSVLKELVVAAEQSWSIYDPEAILDAIKQREELGSTALATGVAIPHPHRPLPSALGDSVIAYGRTVGGVPFGASHGVLTDLFFLVCCANQRTHLRVLARLARMLLRPGFVDQLRAAETPGESFRVIEHTESELIGG